MAQRARIVFSSFPARTDPMLAAWTRFQAELDASADSRRPVAPGVPGVPGASVVPVASAVPVVPVVPVLPAEPAEDKPVRGRAAPRNHSDPAVVWRLLAPNNRELARSGHLYRNAADAERHAEHLQRDTSTLETSLVLGPRPGMRGWVISSRETGVVVLTCGRWYGGAAANAESAAAAMLLLPDALIAGTARPIVTG